jgi:carbonic anhydrase
MNRSYTQLSTPLSLAMTILFGIVLSASAVEIQPTKTVLERLMEGNQRYVTSSTVCHEDWIAKRAALLGSQSPFAIIITCSDSRVPPEIIFDQSLGALFVVRVAGNVIDDFAIGSVEYAVSILGAKLVMVLGHANCGAVDAALRGLKFDNHIQKVLNAIEPAVQATKGESGNLLEKTIKANVKHVEKKLKSSGPVLDQLLQAGKLQIIGAYYHLESGKVEILDKI